MTFHKMMPMFDDDLRIRANDDVTLLRPDIDINESIILFGDDFINTTINDGMVVITYPMDDANYLVRASSSSLSVLSTTPSLAFACFRSLPDTEDE